MLDSKYKYIYLRLRIYLYYIKAKNKHFILAPTFIFVTFAKFFNVYFYYKQILHYDDNPHQYMLSVYFIYIKYKANYKTVINYSDNKLFSNFIWNEDRTLFTTYFLQLNAANNSISYKILFRNKIVFTKNQLIIDAFYKDSILMYEWIIEFFVALWFNDKITNDTTFIINNKKFTFNQILSFPTNLLLIEMLTRGKLIIDNWNVEIAVFNEAIVLYPTFNNLAHNELVQHADIAHH